MPEAKEEHGARAPLRVLALDGGGAYTWGMLKEIEAMLGWAPHQRFDLIYGTSAGAIIAALLALCHSVNIILTLYRQHVPTVMSQKTASARSAALKNLPTQMFGDAAFRDMRTGSTNFCATGVLPAGLLRTAMHSSGRPWPVERQSARLQRRETPGLAPSASSWSSFIAMQAYCPLQDALSRHLSGKAVGATAHAGMP